MPQRISDIIKKREIKHAKEEESFEAKLRQFVEKREAKKPEKEIRRTKHRTSIFSKKVLIPIFLIAFLGGFWGYLSLPNAKVSIWPKLDNINYQVNLTVDKSVKTANFSVGIIPGEFVEVEKEISQNFVSSGKEMTENKAEGTIRIYNNYSTSSQVLIATTRFISDSGKLFRLKNRITVPGATTEKGKLVSSYIDAQVSADKAGEDYNIGPSIFSVPGFAGTPKYMGFYAKSFSQMAGGFIGEKPQITKEDLDKAKNSLNDSILKELRDSLKSKISQGSILLDEATQTKIIETSISAKVGDNLASFTGKIKADSQGIAFKTSESENFVKQYLSSQIQKNPYWVKDNKKIKERSIKINYSVDKLDLQAGKLSLKLDTSAKIFSDLDIDSIKKDVAGFNQAEITSYFEDNPKVERVEVKLWPFWVRKIPQNIEKIKTELIVD